MSPARLAELAGVSRAYGQTVALRGVDLAVRPGEIVGLLGPNGAGKTTALRILVGLRRPDRGRARLFGLDPRRREARLRLGCTPQETSLPPTLTVRETIDLVRAHFPRPARRDHLLEGFDLAAAAGRQAGGLSGGQRRRLAIALAFAGAPDLLVLDEPTTGLDVVARRVVWERIREHAAAGGAVLLTTHYLEEAEALATRVAVIVRGRIRSEGSVRDLRAGAGVTRIRLAARDVPDVGGLVRRSEEVDATALYVRDGAAAVRELVARGVPLDGIEVTAATLEEALLGLAEADA